MTKTKRRDLARTRTPIEVTGTALANTTGGDGRGTRTVDSHPQEVLDYR